MFDEQEVQADGEVEAAKELYRQKTKKKFLLNFISVISYTRKTISELNDFVCVCMGGVCHM